MDKSFSTATLELSPPVFSILNGLIEEKAGLHYGLLDRDLLREKASIRALEAGFTSMLDYYYFLRYDAAGAKEMAELIESLVVNETYFFREWPAIKMLVDSIIDPLCAKGQRPRIWSAACSTGEEPLSLAMLLDQRGLLGKVDLFASDISSRALLRPLRGRYGKRCLRQFSDPALVERYLRADGDEYRIAPELVNKVHWRNLNLMKDEGITELGSFDAILCRNVLIYFSDATVKAVVQRLANRLAPNGALLVGVSESLLRYGTGLVGEERGGSFLYKRPIQ